MLVGVAHRDVVGNITVVDAKKYLWQINLSHIKEIIPLQKILKDKLCLIN